MYNIITHVSKLCVRMTHSDAAQSSRCSFDWVAGNKRDEQLTGAKIVQTGVQSWNGGGSVADRCVLFMRTVSTTLADNFGLLLSMLKPFRETFWLTDVAEKVCQHNLCVYRMTPTRNHDFCFYHFQTWEEFLQHQERGFFLPLLVAK